MGLDCVDLCGFVFVSKSEKAFRNLACSILSLPRERKRSSGIPEANSVSLGFLLCCSPQVGLMALEQETGRGVWLHNWASLSECKDL